MPEFGGAELSFQLLESEPPREGSGFRTSPASSSRPGGEILYAIDQDFARHLLIQMRVNEPAVRDVESAGVHVLIRQLTDSDGATVGYIDVACRISALHRLFAHVVDDILHEIESANTSAGDSCIAVLNRWRELIGDVPSKRLSTSEIVGLMAELHVLLRVARISAASAMAGWMGWDKEKVDFFVPGLALEVKGTSSRDGRTVSIHGLHQLETQAGVRLLLLLVRFDRVGSVLHSLPDLVEKLLALRVSASELHRRLGLLGYDAADGDYYETMRFGIAEELLFEVSNEFPRIVPSGLRSTSFLDRLSNVSYRIDLAGIPVAGNNEYDSAINELGGL